MKNLLTMLLLLVSMTCGAQERYVTHFLGIPVDGTKAEMIEKIAAKGFKKKTDTDGDVHLEGEFNGRKASIYLATNRGKVWRVGVFFGDSMLDEVQVKIHFNELYMQFLENRKYHVLDGHANTSFLGDEDLEYNIVINKKQYQASFAQLSEEIFEIGFSEFIDKLLVEYFGQEYVDGMDDEYKSFCSERVFKEWKEKHSVWFLVNKNKATAKKGEYYISIFYDNGYNKANGEDL